MKNFKGWLFESNTKAKNHLATLVQQGVGAGNRDSWNALLRIVKAKDDTQLQALRQIVSGYVNAQGKPGAAARYLLDTIDEIENQGTEDHFGEKAQEAVNAVTQTLGKLPVPRDLQDELLDLLDKEANNHTFFMQRHYVGGQLMTRVMPVLVKIAEYLFAALSEEEARHGLIEILGDMTYFSEHVPTVEMILKRVHGRP
jgi:hypothetical protein